MPAGASAEGLLRQLPEGVAGLHGKRVLGRKGRTCDRRGWRYRASDVRMRG
jgi:hypothetical protein